MAYTTIDKPTDYFNTVTYSGNGSSTQAITGVGFQPDWVWIKSRSSGSENHMLSDVVRGSTKRLRSDITNAEDDLGSNGIQSFDADGFTAGDGDAMNASGQTYVAWNWLAGSSISGTTTGSGTGKAYSGSVSTVAGFSVIAYTGNGTQGHTIPHGLGAVPKMLIVKRRNSTGGWVVYHEAVGNTKILELHDAAASQTSSAAWNNTTPSSTVFTLGDYTSTNTNDGTYIAYCFAEKKGYSKFGSYTGNGNADGTFVYTGFKPAFILTKGTHSGGHSWNLLDTKRNTFNPADKRITPDTADAEATTTQYDILSNGFKVRNTTGAVNTSGATYIFMAFAESPFVTSTGVPTTAR